MSCSIRLLIIISIFISMSIPFELLFEDDFEEFNETKWEIISSCEGKFTLFILEISSKIQPINIS